MRSTLYGWVIAFQTSIPEVSSAYRLPQDAAGYRWGTAIFRDFLAG